MVLARVSVRRLASWSERVLVLVSELVLVLVLVQRSEPVWLVVVSAQSSAELVLVLVLVQRSEPVWLVVVSAQSSAELVLVHELVLVLAALALVLRHHCIASLPNCILLPCCTSFSW